MRTLRLVSLPLFLASCGYRLEAPPPEASGLTPQLVCNDQLTTTVSLSGAMLRPLPSAVLTDGVEGQPGPSLELPQLAITKRQELDGAAGGDGTPFDLIGFDQADERVLVRWLDESSMDFDIVTEQALPTGIYDLAVTNPDGQGAGLELALAITAPPVLLAMEPNLLCVEQAAQQVTLTGEAFLVVGDVLPTVTLGGVELTPDAAEDCFDLAGPVPGRVCQTLQVTVPRQSLTEGVYAASVTNPETAACGSTQTVEFEVVPPPTLDAVDPQPNCLDQEDRSFVGTGADFLKLADGTLPDVTVGTTTVRATEAAGCVDLLGPAGGQSCSELSFTLLRADEPAGIHDTHVRNPVPADGVSEDIRLELVAEPLLDTVVEDLLCVDQFDNQLVLSGEGFVQLEDGSLPSVAFGADYVTQADALEDCVDLLGPEGGQSCATLRVTLPVGGVPVGVHEVEVTNPSPAECLTAVTVPIEVVAKPAVTSATPLLTCLEQGPTELLIAGTDFLVLADATLPDVTVGTLTVPADSATGCTPLAGPSGGEICTGLVATLPQGALADGVHDVQITNPSPAACASEEVITLETAPAPTLASIDTALTCGDQLDEAFTLTGTGFLKVGSELPTVNLGGYQAAATAANNCVALTGPVTGESCTELVINVPAGTLAHGLLDVSVQNPPDADCLTTQAITLEVLPAPVVTAVLPSELCDAANTVTVSIAGEGFVQTGGQLPTVDMGGVSYVADALSGCTPLLGTVAGEVCTQLDITVPSSTYTNVGPQRVVVTNPAPVECLTSEPVDLAIVPPPVISAVGPSLTCSGGTLTFDGQNFGPGTTASVGGEPVNTTLVDANTLTGAVPPNLAVGVSHDVIIENPGQCTDTLAGAVTLIDPPTLTSVDELLVCGEQTDNTFVLTGTDFLFVNGDLPQVTLGGVTVAASSPAGCSPTTGGSVCTQLTAVFPAGSLDAVTPGLNDISVQNPAPADCSTNTLQIEVLPPPALLALVPVEQCWEVGDFTVSAQGQGFLRAPDGTLPDVLIGAERFAAASATGCVSLAGPAGGEICDELLVNVPADTWAAADTLPAVVSNPAPAACSSTEPVSFTLYDPPRVTGVEAAKVCYGDLDVIVRGTGFRDSPQVEFVGTSGAQAAQSVTFVSENELLVRLPLTMDPGAYDVHVTNPDTCDDLPNPGELVVVEPPIVFFVDPPTTYSGIPVQGTVYVSGINDGVASVWLEEAATGTRTLIDTADFAWDPNDPLRIQALIPANLNRGSYNVFVEDDVGCQVSIDDALFEEDTLTVGVSAIDPPFGWDSSATPVVVEGTGFLDLPRVYLSPDIPGPGTSATELTGVVWQDGQLIDAIVPDGLAEDIYDLIVVNPDGAVGLLPAAYNSMASPPPVIDSVAPGSIAKSTGQLVTIYGANFDTVNPPTVELECVDPAVGGPPTVFGAPEVTVTGNTASTIDLTVDGSVTSNGVCVVVVHHVDGTYARYAAISVVNPSANLYNWRPTTPMQEARRAPMAIAGRVTRTQRFLYTFGGDDGTPAGAKNTWEKSQVGLYGSLSPTWSYNYRDNFQGVANQQLLPSPITMAGVAQIGRFVYLVGGNDGNGPVDTVWRAQILDPLEAPRIYNLEMTLGTGVELDGGEFSYRVAAIFDGADLNNPGGETLASDPLTVRVPTLPDRLKLNLTWTPVPRAVGYRIYRSPSAGLGSKSEVFVADVVGGNTVSWTDDNSATPDTNLTPHETGALGAWAALPTLAHPREAPVVTAAQDPADPTVWYLYAGGGSDGTTIYSDLEFLTLTANSDHDQAVGAWASAGVSMLNGSWGGSAWTVDDRLHTVQAPGESWVYFGAGQKALSGGQRFNDSVQGGVVLPGGTLNAWGSAANLKPERVGSGVLSASNYLYVFGGQQAGPSKSGVSTNIIGPPGTGNWNSLGTSMSENRVWLGSAQESSIVFAVGGQTDALPATATVDFTNF